MEEIIKTVLRMNLVKRPHEYPNPRILADTATRLAWASGFKTKKVQYIDNKLVVVELTANQS